MFLFLCLHPLGSGGVVEHFSSHTSRFFSCARVFCLLASKRGGTLFPLPSDRTTLLRPLNLLSLIISNTLSWCYGSERRTILVICSLFLVFRLASSVTNHFNTRVPSCLVSEYKIALLSTSRFTPRSTTCTHTLSLSYLSQPDFQRPRLRHSVSSPDAVYWW